MDNHSLGGKWVLRLLTAGSLAVGGAAFAQSMGERTGDFGTPSTEAGSTAMPNGHDTTLPPGAIDNVNPNPTAAPPASPSPTGTSSAATKPRAATATSPGGTATSPGAGMASDAARSGGTEAAGQSDDARVVAKLHHVNQMEITAGKLAQDKGQSKQVKDFGARLVRDHQAADKKLMSYADKNGIDANAMPPAGSDEDAQMQAKMDRVRNLSGAEFDSQWSNLMEEGHQKTIDTVQRAQDTVTDAKLKSMLGQLLPTLEKHHQIAQNLVTSTQDQNAANQDASGTTPKSAHGRRGTTPVR